MIAPANQNPGLLEYASVRMALSHASTYALQATLLLAKSPTGIPVPCRQLAREGKMPERFLIQILRRLVRAHILRSTFGVAGGYYLARPPRQISLDDIVAAADLPTPRKSARRTPISPAVNDRIAETLVAAADCVRGEFRKLTLDTLLEIKSPAHASGA